MKTRILLLSLISLLFISCNSDSTGLDNDKTNKILMLKVDYTTNTFVGGTEFSFAKQTDDFTIKSEYVEPGDFGSVKLIYKELDDTLFIGTIHWSGLGEMTFPKSLQPSSSFKVDLKEIFILPPNGFENVFNPDNLKYDDDKYMQVWSGVQNLVKVREYISSNPSQNTKLFLYTPSVGEGDPLDWYWIIYLKS